MVAGALNTTRSFIQACVYQAVRSALTVEIPNTSGAFRPIHVLTKPGTVAEVVMPGASSMRGVTGFRALDAINGALAQLIPTRVGAAGEGGNTLAVFGADRPDGSGRFIFYELVVGTWGGTPADDGNDGLTNPASLAANIPVEVAESEFPIRDRALRARPRQRRRRRAPRRARGRARLALPDARDTSLIVRSDRAGAPALRARRAAGPGRVSSNVLIHADGIGGGAAVDVLDDDRRRATSTSTAWRAAAAGATRSSATRSGVADDVARRQGDRRRRLDGAGRERRRRLPRRRSGEMRSTRSPSR